MPKVKEKETSEIFKPSSGNKVAIRLYCHGLGDCFLMSFKGSGEGRPFYVLIDCGVIQGTDKAKEKMVLREPVALTFPKSTGFSLKMAKK